VKRGGRRRKLDWKAATREEMEEQIGWNESSSERASVSNQVDPISLGRKVRRIRRGYQEPRKEGRKGLQNDQIKKGKNL
jgi:hypothetical protein